jgi:formylglycine-generating enzyme required for sulfatase activity
MAQFRRLIACLVLCLLAAPALAEKRVALVIGNSAYKHAPALANPRNDAEGIATSLRRLKFDVLLGVDLDKPGLERLLRGFADRIEKSDVAMVFYAGHGLQVHGRNYLVPVDAKLDKETDLGFEAISLDFIQTLMEQSQRVNIMMLDACRDNPLARNLARSMGTRSTAIGRGLGQTQAGVGTLIVYATQPGNVALDGEGRNSPFTEALLAHLEAPGLEVRQILTRVRQAVIQATKGRQVPWDSSSLTGDFFFAAAPQPPGTTPPVPPAPVPDPETVFWQSIRDSKNAADYREYVRRWPDGTFAELAKRRIAELEKAASVEPPKPAPVEPKRDGAETCRQSLGWRAGCLFRDCPDCPEMIIIPRGSFLMGLGPTENGYVSEQPRHRVTIANSFALSRYEITRKQFANYVGASGADLRKQCGRWEAAEPQVIVDGRGWDDPGFEQTDEHPVVCVDWFDASKYARWLTQRTAVRYRLPSEAEWEYAARAGTQMIFHWGNSQDTACRFANVLDRAALSRLPSATVRFWYGHVRDARASNCDDGSAFTAPIGRYSPNAFGLFDMIGNVAEWVADCAGDGYSKTPRDGSPNLTDAAPGKWGSCYGENRNAIHRGGSWRSLGKFHRVASRGLNMSGRAQSYDVGIRVARDLD